MTSERRVAALIVYPLKSAGGIPLSDVRVGPDGLVHDRRWMIVDAGGRFVTQRSHPRMALLRTAFGPGALRVSAPGMATLDLPLDPGGAEDSGAPVEEIPVWALGRFARGCGAEADAWASAYVGEPCRMVRAVAPAGEPVLDARGKVRTGFADAYPALLVTTASLDDLNRRLFDPLPMNRFRPNLVIEGGPAYAEDGWRRLAVGPPGRTVTVLGRKPCVRCAIPTTDQDTGARGVEPLRTLAGYRRTPDGEVAFGANVGFEAAGTLRVGDPVAVLDPPTPEAER